MAGPSLAENARRRPDPRTAGVAALDLGQQVERRCDDERAAGCLDTPRRHEQAERVGEAARERRHREHEQTRHEAAPQGCGVRRTPPAPPRPRGRGCRT